MKAGTAHDAVMAKGYVAAVLRQLDAGSAVVTDDTGTDGTSPGVDWWSQP